MKEVEIFEIDSWNQPITKEMQDRIIKALENGKVVYFPSLAFHLNSAENNLLSPDKVDPKSKNISFDIKNSKIGGTTVQGNDLEQMKEMLRRYAVSSKTMMERLFPKYTTHLIQARTSLRPVEISGRTPASYRKDDTRLHVDAFPANPVKGQRILRFFTNINQESKPRVWRVGEPFEDVVKKIAPGLRKPFPGLSKLLKFFKITKDYRTLYDHYMLGLHDTMKGDMVYQKKVNQKEVKFKPGSTWIVYTDQVSHAAMSGQHVLEQTYYLPVEGMHDQETSPLRVLEKYFNKKLV
jgi:3-deoxy-D-manno-oct-2-ulosonic acid (Kdo) hydroxylase